MTRQPPGPVHDLEAYVTSTRSKVAESSRSAIWESTTVPDATTGPIAIPIEQDLIDLVVAPLAPGERRRDGHERREREIAELFRRLTPAQSLALSNRLARAAPADPVVVAFRRLLPERRTRLVNYLARCRAIAVTTSQS